MMDSLFKEALDTWLQSLENYSWRQLIAKPAPGSWSIGQVYMHLIADTGFYMDQIRACLGSNEHAEEDCTEFAREILLKNAFPDEQIEGAPDNAMLAQPASKDHLCTAFINLVRELETLDEEIRNDRCTGKSMHPGFNYLNAREWYQLAGMHFRHHLRQKARIDRFLVQQEID